MGRKQLPPKKLLVPAEKITAIKHALKSGKTHDWIVNRVGVSHRTIMRVKRGYTAMARGAGTGGLHSLKKKQSIVRDVVVKGMKQCVVAEKRGCSRALVSTLVSMHRQGDFQV